jgi:predicted phosphodiesterase
VHIASGQAVPIERLRARCLWYPAVSLDGRMVSGHVLYISQALHEAMEISLGMGALEGWNASAEVDGSEEGVAYRLAAPIRASSHASVAQLLRAVVEHTRQALPASKRRLLATLASMPTGEVLAHLEEILQQHGLHVLVPLQIGNLYQLFTDATEALMPVSPLNLKRTPRLCFVLLSTDSLKNEKRDSPWLRQAAELMALPLNVVRTVEVTRFIDELPALRSVLADEQLVGEILSTLHELTGGWPDLCDRFFDMLAQLPDIAALRERLAELATLLRAAERDLGKSTELLEVAFAGRSELRDLANLPVPTTLPAGGSRPGVGLSSTIPGIPSSPGVPGVYEGLWTLLQRPVPFTWEEHGRGYLDGLISWERTLAVPRSRAIELALRRRLDALAGPGPQAPTAKGPPSSPGIAPLSSATPRLQLDSATVGENPGPTTVRWLHVSDFHFSDKHQAQGGGIVLESLLNTVAEMRRHGRGVDCVFVTGDIAQSGSDAEYRLAEDYLGRLCTALGLPRSAVFMVPGNHDVTRTRGFGLQRTLTNYDEANQYFQPSAERWHLKKLEAFANFYDRFYKSGHTGPGEPRRTAPGLATSQAEVVRVRSLDIGVLPLNSAWFAQDDQDTGKLFIGEGLLRAGLSQIRDAKLRLALVHHPLSDLSDVERRHIQDLIQEHCHFLLRGHLHDNEAGWISSAYRQTMVLAAGAAYQGRVVYQNRAMFVEVDLDSENRVCRVRPYPNRYELTGHDRWTLDTGVFPKSYPTYLETLTLPL